MKTSDTISNHFEPVLSGDMKTTASVTEEAMNFEPKKSSATTRFAQQLGDALRHLHNDESGVAATEYIIVFSLISFGSTIALLATAVYVKAYRDFLVWWLSHPAI